MHEFLFFEKNEFENYKIFKINIINIKDAKVHSNK
jgi:hypothetical protein